MSPRRPHTPWSQARPRLATDHAVVFWRPACPYCDALMAALGDDPRITWVDIRRDPEAAAHVRSVNAGDELVPTALVAGEALPNPSASELRGLLDAG